MAGLFLALGAVVAQAAQQDLGDRLGAGFLRLGWLSSLRLINFFVSFIYF